MINGVPGVPVMARSVPDTETAAVGAATRLRAQQTALSPQAKVEFASFVLAGFLEAAVPKSFSGEAQGGGAGEMWRSMLVDQLARTLAQSGGFDLFESQPRASMQHASSIHSGSQADPSGAPRQPVGISDWHTEVERSS
jgi:hypothetical protein